MNADLYKAYLKVVKPRWPVLRLWSLLMLWSLSLALNLSGTFQFIVTGNTGWMIACLICAVWSLSGIWYWSKVLASKSAYDKLQKKVVVVVPPTDGAVVPPPSPHTKDSPLVDYNDIYVGQDGPVIGTNDQYNMDNE